MDTSNMNHNYSDSNIKVLNTKYYEISNRFDNILIAAIAFGEKLPNSRAREYFVNGVGRRLTIISRCIYNIFNIFPPDRLVKLENNETKDVDINLHAFIINIHGIIENIGLAVAFGYGFIDSSKTENQQKQFLGLFNKKFIKKVGGPIQEYFTSKTIVEWYREYSINYRDSLVHRIPAYVPPAGLNGYEVGEYNNIVLQINKINSNGWTPEIPFLLAELDKLGFANASYVHSASEKAKVVALHPQIMSDYLTIEEMINTVINNYKQ